MEPDELIQLIRDLMPDIQIRDSTVTLYFDIPEQAAEFFRGLDSAIKLAIANDEPEPE